MKKIIATNNDDGQKLLKFLERNFRDVPHSVFRRILRKGDVKIDGKRIRQKDHIVKEGNEILVYGIQSEKKEFIPISHNFKIVYIDDMIMVVDKPKGIVVHGTEDSLDNQVKSYLLENNKWDPEDSFIPSHAHRLDKWTDGLCIYGLNYNALKEMNKLISDSKHVTKKYRAVVEGSLRIDRVVKGFIKEKENGVSFNETNGKEAATRFKTREQGPDESIIECTLITGRKHQIRATLKYLGHPIVGDNRYGNIKIGDMQLTATHISFKDMTGPLGYLEGKIIRR